MAQFDITVIGVYRLILPTFNWMSRHSNVWCMLGNVCCLHPVTLESVGPRILYHGVTKLDHSSSQLIKLANLFFLLPSKRRVQW